MHNQLAEQTDLLAKTVWTDEACFKLSSYVIRHNSVYWADENPRVIMTTRINQTSQFLVAYPTMVSWVLSFLREQLMAPGIWLC
ncbi:hypothetical protein TNCT_642151 [Trichonephila clavata]|uniref:Transposase n=1 Tax=Trichonephila clavata TaxID=2740835 RepID=A0A8X6HD67_TRICU|nr:hypothetical protein TNCT_642151 [Trichonephila clavata]